MAPSASSMLSNNPFPPHRRARTPVRSLARSCHRYHTRVGLPPPSVLSTTGRHLLFRLRRDTLSLFLSSSVSSGAPPLYQSARPPVHVSPTQSPPPPPEREPATPFLRLCSLRSRERIKCAARKPSGRHIYSRPICRVRRGAWKAGRHSPRSRHFGKLCSRCELPSCAKRKRGVRYVRCNSRKRHNSGTREHDERSERIPARYPESNLRR